MLLPIIVKAAERPHFEKGLIGLVSPDAKGTLTTGFDKSMEWPVAHVHLLKDRTAYEAFAPRQY